MHYLYLTDAKGDICDCVPFCSDACHREWCAENNEHYDGWNGCQESADYPEFCANCGVIANAGECDHQRDNVVVNRFLCDEGEKCECGHWIQLPARYRKYGTF